jgi:hypothetical protein
MQRHVKRHRIDGSPKMDKIQVHIQNRDAEPPNGMDTHVLGKAGDARGDENGIGGAAGWEKKKKEEELQ